MNQSPRLSLPYIAPSQAQKHVTHNEALRQLDSLVQLSLEALDATTPPALPEDGAVWALGAVPLLEWAGRPHHLATWTENAWQFMELQIGWTAWNRDTETFQVWMGTSWSQIPAYLGTPDSFGINTAADSTNRLALASDASLFNHNGTSHRMKLNKAAAANTASLLFQSAFSGHAEMGLTGSNNFTLKVSPDGSTWVDAVVVEQGSGKIGMGTNNPAYNLHISSTGSYLALEDSDGVLGGSMSAALRMFAGGVEHGQVGFPGTSSGIMYIRNLQGDLFIEADTRNLASASVIRFAVDGTESMRIEKNKVGIGTATPARALHVSSVMRLEPSTAPTSAAAGDIYFDNATKKLRCHNGTTWINLF